MPVLKLDDIALGISRVRKGNPAGALNFSRYNLAKTGSPRAQDRLQRLVHIVDRKRDMSIAGPIGGRLASGNNRGVRLDL